MKLYDSDFDCMGDFIDRWNRRVKRARVLLVVLGVLLVIGGIAVAVAPYSLYALIQAAAAFALALYGIFEAVSYFGTPELFRSPTLIVMAILNILLGVMLMTLPAYLTASTLVFLLGFLFIVTGIERLSFSSRMRYFQLPHTGMGAATGVINLLLGIVFLFMPLFSGLVLGYLVAAYLVVAGVTLIIEAAFMRRIDR